LFSVMAVLMWRLVTMAVRRSEVGDCLGEP
jgi:hypothetical protein